jgi:hypothetical protein
MHMYGICKTLYRDQPTMSGSLYLPDINTLMTDLLPSSIPYRYQQARQPKQ